MSNKYKEVGSLGNIIRVRSQKTWVIVFPDGEEVKFNNLRLAKIGAKAAFVEGIDINVYEETLMRFKTCGKVNDEKFRIEITERIK